MGKRIFLSPPACGPEELEAVRRALESGYLAPLGPDVEAFEQELAALYAVPHAVPHAVAVQSGTAALHLALLAAGVAPGDSVFCSDLTFAATAMSILYCGATPVFIDADGATWNMDPDLLEQALQEAATRGAMPKAVLLVHALGLPADAPRVVEICARFGVPCIEDAADILGGRVGEHPAGGHGRMTVLSFNGNKIVSASSGGALLCRDERDAERARHLAFMARLPGTFYEYAEQGFSYGLSNICAAVGRAQLRRLDARLARKEAIFNAYVQRLAGRAQVQFMPLWNGGRSNFWLTCVTFGQPLEDLPHDAKALAEARALRDGVLARLRGDDIDARPLWVPMHRQPLFQGARCHGGSVGDALCAAGMLLPSGPQLTEEDLDRICAHVTEAAV